MFHCECRGGRGEHTTQEDEQENPSMMLCVLGTQERKNAGPGATEKGSVQPDQGGMWDSEQGAQARARTRQATCSLIDSVTPDPEDASFPIFPAQVLGQGLTGQTEVLYSSSLTQSSGLLETLC